MIVCAYTEHRWDTLAAALDGVLAQRPEPHEVLVVIDHNDVLLGLAEDRFGAHPRVHVIPSDQAQGLSGARNAGVARATGDVLVFLDDDAVPEPGWLAALLAPYAREDVVGTGGLALPRWGGPRPAWFPDEFLWTVGCSYRGLPEGEEPIRNPIGANMSFAREAFARVGGFTEDLGRVGTLPVGCEETEFAIRVRRAFPGRQVLHAPGSRVAHHVAATRATWSYFTSRCRAEGLSKAVVARFVGTDDALSSERAYATRTLPAGVLRGLADVLQGRPAGALRAGAIVAGFVVTALGYARGRLSRRAGVTPAAPGARRDRGTGAFTPVHVAAMELSEGVRPLVPPPGPDGPYRQARVLVRLHHQPLGIVALEIPDGRVPTAQVLAAVRQQLGAELAEHLAQDGLPPSALTEEGVPAVPDPPCGRSGPHAALAPPVSVVICTRDRADSLRTTLRSVLAGNYGPFEVVVVDNAPRTNATRSVVEELADPRVRLVTEPRPGLSVARNRGAAEARHDVIAFTDDDVIVDPGWLRALVRGFTRAPHVGCVTGAVPPAELDTEAQAFFDAKVEWAATARPRLLDLDGHRLDAPLYPFLPGTFGAGANFAVSRAALQSVGPFDEALGAGAPAQGGEDLDYFLRCVLAGFAVAQEPAAVVWHVHRRELGDLRGQMVGYGSGLSAFAFKHLISPATAPQVLARVPRALVRMVELRGRGGGAAAPAVAGNLRSAELSGLLRGPVRYLRGRRRS